MKDSQLHSQIFVYILTIVLVSFIFVFGYNSIKNVRDRAEQISCLKFENELRNSIESISTDFGSVKRKDLQLCKEYSEVCFVDDNIVSRGSPNFVDSTNTARPADPIIKNSIADGANKNVFLIDGIAKDSFYAGSISVNGDVLCLNAINGKIIIALYFSNQNGHPSPSSPTVAANTPSPLCDARSRFSFVIGAYCTT